MNPHSECTLECLNENVCVLMSIPTRIVSQNFCGTQVKKNTEQKRISVLSIGNTNDSATPAIK